MFIWDLFFFQTPDPRTNHWPLIASPVPGITILAAYLYFVISWGPRYMANRKPFKLENVLIFYNLIQVAVSVFLFYEVSIISIHISAFNECIVFARSRSKYSCYYLSVIYYYIALTVSSYFYHFK